MKQRLGILVILASAAGLAGGCASTGLNRGSADADQVQALEQRVVELQRKAAVTEVELDRLRQRVAELESRQGMAPLAPMTPLPGQARGAREPGSARPGSGAPSASTSTRVATPSVTAATPRSPMPAAASTPVMPLSQKPPATAPPATAPAAPIEERDIEISAAGASAPPGAGSSGVKRGQADVEPVTPALQVLYDRGYTLYHQGHYVDAEASFQRFLQAHPASELSDNAQYWIGECRYSRGDYRGALAAFRETVARYPEGNKVPDALLKAGESLEKLGDLEGARAMYREVIFRFPQTAVAAVAQERRSKLP